MTDNLSKELRSYNMSRIRAKDTKPEVLIRKMLFAIGYRYRLHSKVLPGRPDLIFKKYNTVIFINGCFWHGHSNCSKFRLPKSKTEYWVPKIEGNIRRDQIKYKELQGMNWNVIVVWECSLKKRYDDIKSLLPELLRSNLELKGTIINI